MYKRILVATDGSELSAIAVQHALALARSVGARMTAFHASAQYPIPAYADDALHGVAASNEFMRVAADEAERVLRPIEREAKAAGVACELLQTISDSPWKAILAAARQEGADAIVMASHGRRGISALLLGSQTINVLTHSKIPVIVVR